MSPQNVGIGQRVGRQKLQLAKDLRQRMTPEERGLWERLRGNRLRGRHFRRQQVVDGFVVDFYCHAAGLAIEVDGGVHQDRQQAAYDAERDRALSVRGIRLMRVTNEEVRNDLPGVLKRIEAAVDGGERVSRLVTRRPNPLAPFPPGKGELGPADRRVPERQSPRQTTHPLSPTSEHTTTVTPTTLPFPAGKGPGVRSAGVRSL